MPTCAKCGEKFPNRVVIDGKKRNISSRKYCLTCSPFGRHNTRKLGLEGEGLKCLCAVCGRPYVYDKKAGHTKRYCNTCLVQRRRSKLQRMAVEYRGGECLYCGYSRCVSAMEFHHLDPETKEFGISAACAKTRAWEVIRRELDKCVILCCRCHRELNEGLISPQEIEELAAKAQLVEQPIRNRQVPGSNPGGGSKNQE